MKICSLVRLSTEIMDKSNAGLLTNPDYSLYPVKFAKMFSSSHPGSRFDCLSMAPHKHADYLKICYEYGAEQVYLLNDKRFAGADTYATSLALATAINRCVGGADLVVCSMQSSQGETGHIAGSLASRLGLPFAVGVIEVRECCTDYMVLVQDHGDYAEIIKLPFPAVISLHRNFSFEERLCQINLIDVRKARRKSVCELNHADIDLMPKNCGLIGSNTRMLAGTKAPFQKVKEHRSCVGDTEEQCKLLLQLLDL
ncbi:hypothetical protein NYE46_39890 [Listeria sp. FSL L8-0308]|nr:MULTISPECIES: hypothetical protein [Paenibacillus]KAF6569873.1 hypothetical protein G9G53_21570 [Paenibacillus sp. EKM206P]KAF6585406.1 hypothetical protein G9G52_22680 [Paenibacillus sp. EKM205P]